MVQNHRQKHLFVPFFEDIGPRAGGLFGPAAETGPGAAIFPGCAPPGIPASAAAEIAAAAIEIAATIPSAAVPATALAAAIRITRRVDHVAEFLAEQGLVLEQGLEQGLERGLVREETD